MLFFHLNVRSDVRRILIRFLQIVLSIKIIFQLSFQTLTELDFYSKETVTYAGRSTISSVQLFIKYAR